MDSFDLESLFHELNSEEATNFGLPVQTPPPWVILALVLAFVRPN